MLRKISTWVAPMARAGREGSVAHDADHRAEREADDPGGERHEDRPAESGRRIHPAVRRS